MLAIVGPSLIWCAEYIGSGEVILATRTGAILGVSVLWAVVLGIFLKYWIGLSGGIYTVCTGEGMMDMFARIPGPRHWAVWLVLLVQLGAGAVAMGSLASAAGAFMAPLTQLPPFLAGWLATAFAVGIAWTSEFKLLKIVMSCLVAVTVLGVLNVASHVCPPVSQLFKSLIPSGVEVPDWAVATGVSPDPWKEILPLIGWGAGGFASQVWYTYWVLGAGYGAAADAEYGTPADVDSLAQLTEEDGQRLKQWCRVIYVDATLALIIGTVATAAFLIAGAGILGPNQQAPAGDEVATGLAALFSERWGQLGATLFLLGGTAALLSTLVGQFAGWPRLIADGLRICIPRWGHTWTWKTQFRILLAFFFVTNMIVVYSFGYRPVAVIQFSAIFDGLLLTPFQAVWVGLGLFWVLPRMLSREAYQAVKPGWPIAAGLAVAAVVFAGFCLIQIPVALR